MQSEKSLILIKEGFLGEVSFEAVIIRSRERENGRWEWETVLDTAGGGCGGSSGVRKMVPRD